MDGALTEKAPAAAQAPAAAEDPVTPAATEASPAPAPRLAESTLNMAAAAIADQIPAPKVPVTSEETLIIAAVPAQGPVRAGEARPAADQVPDERAPNQERTSRR